MFKKVLAGTIASCILLPATAVELGIASFNLAWAGTEDDFKEHIRVCKDPKVNWCDTRAKIPKDATEPTPQEKERAKSCQAAFDKVAGGPGQALQVAPCNAYDLSDEILAKNPGKPADLYRQKLEGLKGTIHMLVDKHKVDILAFQEVKSAEVIRILLGEHVADFETCAAPHTAFQTIGFAWRKSLGEGVCKPEPSLSIEEDLENSSSVQKFLRPGIELSLSIGQQKLSLLNVHLKSSCANLHKDKFGEGKLLTSEAPACQVLNRQVAPLETWIEAVAQRSPLFVVLGDFNRKIDDELAEDKKIPPDQVRTDGVLPNKPNKMDGKGSVKSKYLWQEISDGDPSLVQVPLSGVATGCRGFVGLDHILLSATLNARQKNKPISSKIQVQTQSSQVIETSDHCPRVTRVNL
ncbi:hypothetical protein DW355_06685 [Hylemonella gracilis]|uniref:Endonuclease/exonuclease/phosphatase domain-containing protein n=1 Tax=Hylemonella gracilis TaxID=80880 RepID=A0A4P6UJB8_9BURK|nr:hypothetical protein [Hylemonella gracilis]QBK04514.1 hypothetical protein DW355_06685 [Hylemonella gracilis]